MQNSNTVHAHPGSAAGDAMQNVEMGIPADSQVAVAYGYMTRAKQSLAHVTLDELEQTLPLPPNERILPLEDGEEYQYFLQVHTGPTSYSYSHVKCLVCRGYSTMASIMLRVGAEQTSDFRAEQSLGTAATLKCVVLLIGPSMSASRRNVVHVHRCYVMYTCYIKNETHTRYRYAIAPTSCLGCLTGTEQ